MGKSVGEIRTDLVNWIPSNMEWIKQISAFLLDKKGIKIMDNIQPMIRLDFVVDQIALLIITCMYNIHIGVILSKKFWCTHANQNIEKFEKSDIILAYMGSMKFEETRSQKLTAENVYMSKLLFNFKPEHKQKVNKTHTQSSAEIEDVTPKPPPSPSPWRSVPDSPSGQNEENQVVPPDDLPKSESPLVSPQRSVPNSPAAGQNEENQAVPTDYLPKSESPLLSSQRSVPDSPATGQNEENQAVPPDDMPKSESPPMSPQKLAPGSPADEIEENQAVEPQSPPPMSPQRLVPDSPPDSPATLVYSSPVQLSSDDTEDVFSSHEDGYNMYKNQPVVLLDHLTLSTAKMAPHSMSAARSAPHNKSAARSAPHSRCVKENAICLVCHKKFASKLKVTGHVREHHPSFKFSCSFCERKYDTYNGQVKHKKTHMDLHYSCGDCGSQFQFKFQLGTHERIHNKNEQIKCTKCPHTYTSESAMSAHLAAHRTKRKLICDQSGHVTNNKSNLDQHTPGKHGEGWVSECGDHFSWHMRLYQHYEKCKRCEDIQNRKDSKMQKLHRVKRQDLNCGPLFLDQLCFMCFYTQTFLHNKVWCGALYKSVQSGK